MSNATDPETLALSRAERAALQKLHHNRCPECGTELSPISFHNVTIQHCFCCKGSFLPAEELDKLAASRTGVFRTLVTDVLRVFEHKHTM